ncbi:hypothetical protein CesoFtcFv8_025716 [Champsocephalus esox]|uniref:Uncharacterized protein n=2 Tax=Champsocephalus TaxID=52236 RepID=A0AAN8GYG6_CHAGU|nr:hypothetical protein CesoFtcFv8_025716 [Champsocephalus esox]KAK5895583.1 hypothetical protein CgunFtcFv8_009265 [Champsocephalus gunnari]
MFGSMVVLASITELKPLSDSSQPLDHGTENCTHSPHSCSDVSSDTWCMSLWKVGKKQRNVALMGSAGSARPPFSF